MTTPQDGAEQGADHKTGSADEQRDANVAERSKVQTDVGHRSAILAAARLSRPRWSLALLAPRAGLGLAVHIGERRNRRGAGFLFVFVLLRFLLLFVASRLTFGHGALRVCGV
jgi:hypothetical protein